MDLHRKNIIFMLFKNNTLTKHFQDLCVIRLGDLIQPNL